MMAIIHRIHLLGDLGIALALSSCLCRCTTDWRRAGGWVQSSADILHLAQVKTWRSQILVFHRILKTRKGARGYPLSLYRYRWTKLSNLTSRLHSAHFPKLHSLAFRCLFKSIEVFACPKSLSTTNLRNWFSSSVLAFMMPNTICIRFPCPFFIAFLGSSRKRQNSAYTRKKCKR